MTKAYVRLTVAHSPRAAGAGEVAVMGVDPIDMYCASCHSKPGEPCCFPRDGVTSVLRDGLQLPAYHIARINAVRDEEPTP